MFAGLVKSVTLGSISISCLGRRRPELTRTLPTARVPFRDANKFHKEVADRPQPTT